jgi:SAM-dependent methyltransferase
VGCGTGNVARPLTEYVEHIDAVDLSLPMLERARTLPGGYSPKVRWLHGRAEDVELEPPYALVTAGESLHWMEWDVVLPRFAQLLMPHGVLAIVHIVDQPVLWREGYCQIEQRFTNNPSYVPFDWIVELEKYGLFQKLGESWADGLPAYIMDDSHVSRRFPTWYLKIGRGFTQFTTRRQERQSERRTSNLFTTFLTSPPDLERFFQASKRQFSPFSENSHPSVQNWSALR